MRRAGARPLPSAVRPPTVLDCSNAACQTRNRSNERTEVADRPIVAAARRLPDSLAVIAVTPFEAGDVAERGRRRKEEPR
jgi:hypothetical protein